jgi:hypothetical protein
MKIDTYNKPLLLDIYGFASIAANKDYAGTAFRLMDKMWQVVKANNLKNKGLNIWVYEPGDGVFAGIELAETPVGETGLQNKRIHLLKYAYYKHIGPYNLIKQAGKGMTDELAKMGLKTKLPYIEIYGHWSNDESKLETELIMALA